MPAATAAELHDRAVAEAARGRHAAARRLLAMALRAGPDPARRAHILVSLAYQEAERRDLSAGLAMLADAEGPDLPRRLRGLVAAQRGMLYMRAARFTDALTSFDAALRQLDESAPEDMCRALLNRAQVHEQRRSLSQGRADNLRCADIAARHGLDILAAKAQYNLGVLARLAGDLPHALAQLDSAARKLATLSPTLAAVCHLDRAHVLLAAGLTHEADGDLAQAIELFAAGRDRQDQAQAELARAEVACLIEEWADARRLANQARRRFHRRGAEAWALLAELVAVTADVGSGRGLAQAAAGARHLAAVLAEAGLEDEARRAALTAATAQVALGDPDGARLTSERAARLHRDDPLATRLLARSVRARLAAADGQPRRAEAERRAALRELHRYQSLFGSLDLQAAVSGYGDRVAEEGLTSALAGGRPAAVFGWAERSRALSTRLPAVIPPADPEAARALEELRQVSAQIAEQAVARRPVDPGLRGRRRQLERLVRQRSWYLTGQGRTTEPAQLGLVQEQVATVGGTLVAHLVCHNRVYGLVAGPRRRALRDLGPADPVVELQRRLRADLDLLAAHNIPGPVRDTVHAASRNALHRLDDLLFGPVRALLSDGPLLLVPAARLVALPWTLLATAHGRPVTVVPSATSWLAAREQVTLPDDPAVVLAAGPRIDRGVEELRLVAEQWQRTSTLAGDRATTAAVCAATGRADVLHMAAHGVHEPDNPLFSHLELADGPLFGYELGVLPRLPAHVVLSACELGQAEARRGEESLGMTAVLLHGGAGSVVAGVARISDTAACTVGAAHHAGLSAGLSPAAALSAAMTSANGNDPAPLVCFGAGW